MLLHKEAGTVKGKKAADEIQVDDVSELENESIHVLQGVRGGGSTW